MVMFGDFVVVSLSMDVEVREIEVALGGRVVVVVGSPFV